MGKGTTLPHTNSIHNSPTQSSTFPLTVTQGLALYPWVQTKSKDILESLLDGRHHLQFTRLVRLLSGPPQAVTDKGVSLKDANHITFQVDSQNIMNHERDLHFQN